MDETPAITGPGDGKPAPLERPAALAPETAPVTLQQMPRHSYETRMQDQQFLGLLSIFHFVLGGLMFVFGLFPLIYMAIGFMLVNMPIRPATSGPAGSPTPPGPSPVLIGWLFIVVSGLIILILYALGILACVTGYYLRRRQRWQFCLVGAAILCLNTPFGTVLGVFTIIVLLRESVKDLFQYGDPTLTEEEDA